MFKCYNSWNSDGEFSDLVNNAISEAFSSDVTVLHVKMKIVKNKIRTWAKDRCINGLNKKADIMGQIDSLKAQLECSNTNLDSVEALRTTRLNLVHELDKIERDENIDVLQKSRIKWDVEGDENSKKKFIVLLNRDFAAPTNSVTFPELIPEHVIEAHDRSLLEADVSETEIRNAIWECGSDKAPRPDGFTFAFVKKIWEALKSEFCSCISQAFRDGVMPKGVGSAFITLIPKVLVPVGSHGFVCLNSARTSILINGSPTKEFKVKRGLRQGDPLSSFLFLIVMEGLNLCHKRDVELGNISGTKIGSPSVTISHLFYADDAIIVSKWNCNELRCVINVLEWFHVWSGLSVNVSKSSLFGVCVSTSKVEDFIAFTGCSKGEISFSYLGLPMGFSMNNLSHWNPLLDKFKKRLASWKASLLSIGGRLTLIRSVLNSLGIYFFIDV
ncbi:uncharacterized protein [Rutidosis leptorrhynchoides]|uniref:uncharacterized protein n=1 Tax=Rutidosis leptorrhynchoides TaxID=125765 RepID=UPI003A99472B